VARERGAQIDGCRSLADAPLLIRYGYDSAHFAQPAEVAPNLADAASLCKPKGDEMFHVKHAPTHQQAVAVAVNSQP
jgi:hypothetical protein